MKRLVLLFTLLSALALQGQTYHYPWIHTEFLCYTGCVAQDSTQAFTAAHADWVDGGVPSLLNPLNSNIKTFSYALNWSTFDDYQTTISGYAANLETGWWSDAATWATANSVNQENLYLHTAVGYNPTSCTSSTKTYLGSGAAQAWGAGCSYVLGDLVTAGGVIYIAASSSTGQTPPSTSGNPLLCSITGNSYWKCILPDTSSVLYCPTPGQSKACRLSFSIWGEHRWAVNAGNANLVAYQQNRMPRILSDQGGGWSSIWFDESDSVTIASNACGATANTLEYGTSCTQYYADMATLLAAERTALGGQRIQINTAQQMDAADISMAAAAGSTFTEMAGTITNGIYEYWAGVDAFLAAGASVAYASDWPTATSGSPIPATMSAGNYDTPQHRYQLTTIVNTYMVAPATLTDNFFFTPDPRFDPNISMSDTAWPGSLAVNVGTPTGARTLVSTDSDSGGYVYSRAYTNALMLMHVAVDGGTSNYGDSTAVSVTLPAGTWSQLNWDGSTTPVSGTVSLRKVEGVILMSGTPPSGTTPGKRAVSIQAGSYR